MPPRKANGVGVGQGQSHGVGHGDQAIRHRRASNPDIHSLPHGVVLVNRRHATPVPVFRAPQPPPPPTAQTLDSPAKPTKPLPPPSAIPKPPLLPPPSPTSNGTDEKGSSKTGTIRRNVGAVSAMVGKAIGASPIKTRVKKKATQV